MVSRACPFCGGPQIVKREGEYICAYCLQPLDFSNGKLSDGYNKLASFNFAGAASFFAQASGEGAEALYGLFLARNKIEENRTKSGVTPIIYTYRPESFETDPDYISLKTACAGERALLKKLEKIEEARRTTLEPTRACDAVIFYDPGTIAESAEFADELSSRGYEVLRTSDFSAADIATLRCARAAYAFASSEYTVQKLAESKVARRYALLENSRGTMGKKPLKLVTREFIPELLLEAVRDAVTVVAELDPAAEARRINAGGTGAKATVVRRAGACTASVKSRGSAEYSAVDTSRIEKSLYEGDYSDALNKCEKLCARGDAPAKVYWLKFLACAKAKNGEELIRAATGAAFTQEAMRALDGALYRCESSQAAKEYTDILADTALRLIDRRLPELALRALDAAFCYDPSDSYAERILGRLDAAKVYLSAADYISLYRRVVSSMASVGDEIRFKYAKRAIEFALSRGDFSRADDLTEGALELFPDKSELYKYKLLCTSRASSYAEVFSREYPLLGEAFGQFAASLGATEKAKALKSALDILIENARDKGFESYSAAIFEVLGYGDFPSGDYCRAGEAALYSREFEDAAAYFAEAAQRDEANHLAYWGALKAALGCRTDRELEECDTPIDTVGGYFARAYACASARDKKFAERMEEVRDRRRTIEKLNGHVFRKEDFVLRGDTVVAYKGEDTDRVYVGGGVKKIAPCVFRGAAVHSVILGETVTHIGDYAFAYSDIKTVTLPRGVASVGVNPFCGCEKLSEINAGGSCSVAGGVFYFGDSAVAYCRALAGADSEIQLRSGTRKICAKAFYFQNELRVKIPRSTEKIEPCAFYGCENLEISGSVPECRPSFTGEAAVDGAARGERWESLYGESANAASPYPLSEWKNLPASGDSFALAADTRGKPSGGFLIKNDRAIFTRENTLCAYSLIGGDNSERKLTHAARGTGVLWNEFLILPTDKDGGTLVFIDENGEEVYEITVGLCPTRPLCLAGDTLLCACGDTLAAADLRRGKVVLRNMGEKITSVPSSCGEKFFAASEKRVYALDLKLRGDAVHTLLGVNYSERSGGKILRGRIVCHGGRAYWVERTASGLYLGVSDGVRAVLKNIPRAVADFVHTQPVLGGGNVYLGTGAGIVAAKVRSLDEEWTFKQEAACPRYTDIMLLGGSLVALSPASGRDMRLRAAYRGRAVCTDAERGGIYAARI